MDETRLRPYNPRERLQHAAEEAARRFGERVRAVFEKHDDYLGRNPETTNLIFTE